MRVFSRTLVIPWLAVVVAGGGGCTTGRIGAFTVVPNPACLDQQVYITFDAAEGDPALTAEPAIAEDLSIRPGQRFGVKTIRAERDTAITFRARGTEGSDERTINLVVRDPGQPIELAAAGSCPGPTWTASVLSDQWPAGAEVVRVTNLEPMSLTVEHEGRRAALGPGGSATASSAELDRLPLTGGWRLVPALVSTPCPAGCESTGGCPSYPPLRIAVTWRCPPSP